MELRDYANTLIFGFLGPTLVGIGLRSGFLMSAAFASFKFLNGRPRGDEEIIQLQNLRSLDSRKVPSAPEPQISSPSPWERLQVASFGIAWYPHLPSLADTSTHPVLTVWFSYQSQMTLLNPYCYSPCLDLDVKLKDMFGQTFYGL